MSNGPTQLVLDIDAGRDADQQELDQLSEQLREQLRQLEIERVDLVRKGPANPRAKGDVVTLGTLAVTLGPVQ